MTAIPEVLFVCVHNAGGRRWPRRCSIITRRGACDRSLGGQRAGRQINPAVVGAMGEIGLDLSKEFPKPLTDELVHEADVVITMGCGDACPFYPGKRYLDWELDDPAGKSARRRPADPRRDRPPRARRSSTTLPSVNDSLSRRVTARSATTTRGRARTTVGRDDALVGAAAHAVGDPLGEIVVVGLGPAAVDLEPRVACCAWPRPRHHGAQREWELRGRAAVDRERLPGDVRREIGG